MSKEELKAKYLPIIQDIGTKGTGSAKSQGSTILKPSLVFNLTTTLGILPSGLGKAEPVMVNKLSKSISMELPKEISPIEIYMRNNRSHTTSTKCQYQDLPQSPGDSTI
jgi:hypothetical protein